MHVMAKLFGMDYNEDIGSEAYARIQEWDRHLAEVRKKRGEGMTEPTNTLPEPYQSGMLKPKPCPFCGSDDVREFTPSAYEIGDGAEVRCQNPLCEAGVHGNTIEIARVKWSRRVNE